MTGALVRAMRGRVASLSFLALTSSLFAYAYRDILGYGMLSVGDLAPFPESRQALEAFLFSWQPQSMGTSMAREARLFIIGVLVALFGDNAVMAQKVFYLSLLPLASITMYIFLNRLVRSRFGKIVASLLYIATIEPIWAFVNGSMSFLFLHAIYPLLLLALFNVLDGAGRLRNMFIFTALLGVAASFHPQVLFFFAPFMIVFSLIGMLRRRSLRHALTTALLISASLALCYLLGSPFWAPYGLPSFVFPYEMVVGLPIERLIQDVTQSYRHASITNLAMLNVAHPVSLLLPIFAFSSLLLSRDGERLGHALGFSIIVFSLTLFGWLTHLGLTLDLFRRLPFLFTFREMAKITYILLLAYPPLLAIAIDGIQDRFKRSVERRGEALARAQLIGYGLALSAISVVLVFNIALYEGGRLLRGDMALHEYRGTEFVVPTVCLNAGNWLDARRREDGFFRTLWCPLDFHTQRSLTWLDPYTFSVPAQGEVLGLPNIDYVKFALELFCVGRTSHLGSLLAPANVKYVIVNLAFGDRGPARIVGTHKTYYPMGEPMAFVEILNEQEDLRLVAREGEFLVYENTEFIPHIVAYDRAFFVASPSHVDHSSISQNVTENLILNPGFELDLTPWKAFPEKGVSPDDAVSRSGRFGVKLTNERRGTIQLRQSLHVYGGEQYDVSFWMKIGNANSSGLKLVWYDEWYVASEEKPIREDVLEKASGKEIDWWQVTARVTSPMNAVRMDVVCLGGWSYDGVNPGSTWFDDVSVLGVYSPLPGPTSSLSSMMALSHIPSFDLDGQLLFFEEGGIAVDEARTIRDHSDALVLLNDSPKNIDDISADKHLILIMEAEAAFIPESGYWIHPLESSASNGYVMTCMGGGEATGDFSVPRSGRYRMALRASTDGHVILTVDGETKPTLTKGVSGFQWFETDPFLLEGGVRHEVSIRCDGDSTALDELVVFSANDGEELKEILESARHRSWEPLSERVNPTEYRVEVRSGDPFFLVLGESYDPNWSAYLNGERLEHFKSSRWSNGFYSEEGGTITIIFDRQKSRDQTLAMWAGTWLFVFTAIAYTSVRRPRCDRSDGSANHAWNADGRRRLSLRGRWTCRVINH